MRKAKAHGGDIERAVERYNEAANKHNFSPCETRTGARQRRLAQRLEEIGGLENFYRALSAIPKNDWLMGRVKNPSRTPFKLNIDSLMQTGGKSGDVLANLLDEALAVERAQCERFEVDWFIAFGNHMLGDRWQPPQWVADFPAPWADGQPVTNEAARAWVRECRPWSDLVDRYVSGGDCEEEFKRIRHEMFDTGERERLSASRREALERKYQADAEQSKQAALEREERGLEREREEGEAVRAKEEASKTFWQELKSRPPPVVSDELKRFLSKSAN